MSREMAKKFAGQNDVSIYDLLSTIHIFHESGKWNGHPYIELNDDGSGRVVQSHRMKKYVDDDTIFSFHNLHALVAEGKRLVKECDIKWEDDLGLFAWVDAKNLEEQSLGGLLEK